MSDILDSGALIALEADDRRMWRRLKAALQAESPPKTHGGVVAQVWRGGAGRQARLAAALGAVEVVPLDEGLGRRAGVLLARCGLTDAIDAALVCLAGHGDQIFTSDPDDMAALAAASNRRIDVVPV
ncbi:MAG: PIN domain-containing protein [Acidimicrobiaceae bacterium]|nr:PIN domain-containing protein [Acidimicrobiaceae bacterium]MYE09735.1 PIN domain-containing protein [Acidimicrobiaceae bacterium]MYI36273.1 PIN domain-containing protein [Acidimicrobiaceae bacterium]